MCLAKGRTTKASVRVLIPNEWLVRNSAPFHRRESDTYFNENPVGVNVLETATASKKTKTTTDVGNLYLLAT